MKFYTCREYSDIYDNEDKVKTAFLNKEDAEACIKERIHQHYKMDDDAIKKMAEEEGGWYTINEEEGQTVYFIYDGEDGMHFVVDEWEAPESVVAS